jgi:uncharacterized Zn finger protein
MTCSRCCGLMVDTQVLDLEGAYGEMWATSRRCVNCGHVHDAVVEQHRRSREQKVLVAPSGEPDYQDEEVHLGAESLVRQAA